MGLVINAAFGALVVLLIGVLAKTKNYYIAGLIPLFPTFALIAHYIVASERGIEALRATIIFSMWSITYLPVALSPDAVSHLMAVVICVNAALSSI
ncbi:GlpM family protein [Shigella sonnei]|uniref:GlpM family protein n=1 Tax=Shigella sonnei TaxID=624 RepID=UPI00080C3EDB|nr:hypothetical protein AWZ62_23960 [Shigella sonnei]